MVWMQAVVEKDLGNTAYKKKDFETAMKHYNKAVDLDSTNIIFRNNRAGEFSLYFFILYCDNASLCCCDTIDLASGGALAFGLLKI